MIDPRKYGTATEAARLAGIERRTLATAMARGDELLEVTSTVGGTLLVSVKSAHAFKATPPKRGPKFRR